MSVEIIAEVGSSHNGDLNTALELIKTSALAGANTVKFQLFTPDLWHASDPRHDKIKPFCVPESWLPRLIAECDEWRVEFLCTPFSLHAVETLEKLGVKRYKVASGDLTYTPLLAAIAQTHKPILLSVGFSTDVEIEKAIDDLGGYNITLLHCVGGYPTLPIHANLRRILDLWQNFGFKYNAQVGVSSHLREWWVDVAAVAFNAKVIEKHVDLPGRPGPEGGHSLDPLDFADFVLSVRDMKDAMTKQTAFCDDDEYARLHYRRDPDDWQRPLKSVR